MNKIELIALEDIPLINEGDNLVEIILIALEEMSENIQDYFSSNFRKKDELYILQKALEQIHKPENEKSLNTAIYRLKYDEHFFLQLLMALKKPVSYTHLTLPTKA